MQENYTFEETMSVLRTARSRGRKEGAIVGFALIVAIEVFVNTAPGKKLTKKLFNREFVPMT